MHKISTYKAANGDTLGIRNIEIDNTYFGKGIEAMSGAELVAARESLIDGFEYIVLYTAEAGMSDKECEELFVNARALNVENISFKGAPASGWDYAKKLSRACNITLLFETYQGYDFAEYAALRDENTGIIYNPLEYVKEGRGAYFAALYKNKFKDDVKILRINDGVIGEDKACLPEHGNAEVRECVSTLLSRCYEGWFSICAVDGELSGAIAETKRIFKEV